MHQKKEQTKSFDQNHVISTKKVYKYEAMYGIVI